MKKKNKQLSDAEFEMLHERAMLQAQYMKNKETLTIDWIPF